MSRAVDPRARSLLAASASAAAAAALITWRERRAARRDQPPVTLLGPMARADRIPTASAPASDTSDASDASAFGPLHPGRLEAILDHAHDLLFVLAADGTVRWANAPVANLTGIDDVTSIFGIDARAGFEGEDLARFDEAFALLNRTGGPVTVELASRQMLGGGTWRAVGVLLPTDETVWIARDVTDERRLEAEIEARALADPLTGLANRTLFMEHTGKAIERLRRAATPVAVVRCDIDGFAAVNEAVGYSGGDEVLRALAARAQRCGRDGDTVARLDGDEFAVLIDGGDREAALLVAERMLSAMAEPVRIDGVEICVTVSIGVTVADTSDTVEGLVQRAEKAARTAKAAGRNRIEVYRRSLDVSGRDRLKVFADLRRAIDRDQFELHYQPVISLATGAPTGVEGLLRWNHPTRGAIAAGEFIPFATRAGLVVELGRRALRQACADVSNLAEATGRSLPVHVNVSWNELDTDDLPVFVRRTLERTGLDPELLVFELSERDVLEHLDEFDRLITRLAPIAALGVRLSLDDFGPGTLPFAQLRKLPIATLKLHQSVIAEAALGPGASDALVRSAVEIGATMRATVCAVGVETLEVREHLASLGVASAQGFGIARPVPNGQLAEILAGLDRSAAPVAA